MRRLAARRKWRCGIGMRRLAARRKRLHSIGMRRLAAHRKVYLSARIHAIISLTSPSPMTGITLKMLLCPTVAFGIQRVLKNRSHRANKTPSTGLRYRRCQKAMLGVRVQTWRGKTREVANFSSVQGGIYAPGETHNKLLYLFRYPFHPRVTAVARKRPRSFCQKRRWQVTTEHAYTLRMWLWMKWHGAWCTQNAPRWQQFHVAPGMPAL